MNIEFTDEEIQVIYQAINNVPVKLGDKVASIMINIRQKIYDNVNVQKNRVNKEN